MMSIKQPDKANVDDIMNALNSYIQGEKVDSICKLYDIDDLTFNRWYARYGVFASKYYQMKMEHEHLKKKYQSLFESHEALYEKLDLMRQFVNKLEG
ncbi:hypothetical protein, partial [Pedobacter jejuensis]